jgi:hypothetical protein
MVSVPLKALARSIASFEGFIPIVVVNLTLPVPTRVETTFPVAPLCSCYMCPRHILSAHPFKHPRQQQPNLHLLRSNITCPGHRFPDPRQQRQISHLCLQLKVSSQHSWPSFPRPSTTTFFTSISSPCVPPPCS